MKTLALKKIEERRTFMLKRVEHRAHFIGYVRAFWDMELLTDEEQKTILRSFVFKED